jgi:starch synthase (maltosyl-transferring)
MHQLIKKVNRIRRDNSAFQSTFNITFCETDNEQLLAFMKISDDKKNIILTVVNLDPVAVHKGWVHVPVDLFKVHDGHSLNLHDLMDDNHYHWNRQWNYVELDPSIMPMHIFRLTINT